MDEIIRNKIDGARKDLQLRYPYLTFLILKFPVSVKKYSIPSYAALEKDKIYFNETYIHELSRNEIMAVLAHEHFHAFLGHISRLGRRDPFLWNTACDIVVNIILKDLKFSLPKGVILPKNENDYRGKSAEEVYDMLKGTDPVKLKGLYGKMDNHSFWEEIAKRAEEGDKEAKEFLEEIERVSQGLKEYLKQLEKVAKGDIPAELLRQAQIVEKQYISWKFLLRKYLSETLHRVNYSFLPPNPVFWETYDIALPKIKRTGRSAKIALAIDTSGSMAADELSEILGEIHSLLRGMDVDLNIFIGDCGEPVKMKLNSITNRDGVKKIAEKLMGGGGTDFRPIFNALKKLPVIDRPKALFFFTDGDGDYPSRQPPFDTIWILTKGDRQVPFGKKIVLERRS